MLSTRIARTWHGQLVTLQQSVIMGEYNTPDTVVRDRSSKSVMKNTRVMLCAVRCFAMTCFYLTTSPVVWQQITASTWLTCTTPCGDTSRGALNATASIGTSRRTARSATYCCSTSATPGMSSYQPELDLLSASCPARNCK